jgi:uncharacterized protein YndB with AHSA1/START domain
MTRREAREEFGEGPEPSGSGEPPRGTVSLDRVLPAPVEAVWEHWTTKEGLEPWWGPADVATTVRTLELRPGGLFLLDHQYITTVGHPERIAAFEAAGVPVRYVSRGRFGEVRPCTLLSFRQLLDFGPRTRPTELSARVELRPHPRGTHMVLQLEGTLTAHWRSLAKPSLEEQVDRLVESLRDPRDGHPDPVVRR